MTTARTMTLTDQLACAKRELALRQRDYPRFTQMSEAKKAYELAAMQAIIETLEAVRLGDQQQLVQLQRH